MKQGDEIRIGDLLHVILKRKILIVTLAICGLVVGIILSVFSYMRGEMSRTYAITSAIAVTAQTQDGLYTSKERTPNSTDITLAENMADSVIYVLKSDKTLDLAIRRVSLVGISVKDIYRNLTVSKVGSTQIIELTLYWRNAEEGVEILNAINTVAPGVMSEVLNIGNVSVVNNPKSQYRIGGSVNAKLWVLMVFAFAALGIGLCVLEYFLRPRLIETEDLEKNYGLRVLGEIPENKKAFPSDHPTMQPMDEGIIEEKLISAARILDYEMKEQRVRIAGVTSMSSGEGTSTMTACLGYELGEMGRKVLLVDLNLRNPMLGIPTGEKPDVYHSLNGLYYGVTGVQDAMIHLTGDVDVLPSMIDADRPLRINDDLLELIRKVGEGYEAVLVDLPPVTVSSDALAIRKLTDQIVLVARRDTVLLADLKDGLERMRKAGLKVLGVVANGMKGGKKRDAYQGKRNEKMRRMAKTPEQAGAESVNEAPEENRVMHNAGMDRQGVLDESLERNWEVDQRQESR